MSSIKCQNVKNVHHKFSVPKVKSLKCFSLTSSLNYNVNKQQILTVSGRWLIFWRHHTCHHVSMVSAHTSVMMTHSHIKLFLITINEFRNILSGSTPGLGSNTVIPHPRVFQNRDGVGLNTMTSLKITNKSVYQKYWPILACHWCIGVYYGCMILNFCRYLVWQYFTTNLADDRYWNRLVYFFSLYLTAEIIKSLL